MYRVSISFLLTVLILIIGCKTDNPEIDEVKRSQGKANLRTQAKEEKFKKFPLGEKPIMRGEVGADGKKRLKRSSSIEWKQISDISSKKRITKKNLIFIQTDWSDDCRKMEETTFKDKKIIQYLIKNFNAVKLNGEEKSTLNFDKKKYKFIKSGRRGSNLLPLLMMNGVAEYPSVVVLDNQLKKIKVLKGFRTAKELLVELKSL